MLLADMELALRQDLNDLDATQYRWSSTVLDRCIARALREYSFVWPRIQGMIMPAQVGVRAYPLPVSSALAAPAAPALTVNAGTGSLPPGPLYVRVTACTANSESAPSVEAAAIVAAAGSAVQVDLTPLAGASFYNVYVGAAGAGESWNGQTEASGPEAYTISSLAPPPPSLPSGSPPGAAPGLPLLLSEPAASIDAWWVESVEFPVGLWPPRFVPFEEQGGLFILNLDSNRLPVASGQSMNVIYAGSHQLDAGGSTIPDQDWDVLAQGAYGYACLQYGLPAADNFEFQDGEVRDRVDDSMVPRMWRQFGLDALSSFRARLEDIRKRRDFAAAALIQWGDVPRRWDRL